MSTKIKSSNFQVSFHESENADLARIVLPGSDGGIKWASKIAAVFHVSHMISW